jgi:hypothetical protein
MPCAPANHGRLVLGGRDWFHQRRTSEYVSFVSPQPSLPGWLRKPETPRDTILLSFRPTSPAGRNSLAQGVSPISVNLKKSVARPLPRWFGQGLANGGPALQHGRQVLRQQESRSNLPIEELNFAPSASAKLPRSSPRGKMTQPYQSFAQ